jgi:TonB family protein
MTSYSMLISSLVLLFINLTLLGAPMALAVAVAFKFLPTSSARTRYLIALFAFGAASLIPVLATSSLNTYARLPGVSRLALPPLIEAGDVRTDVASPVVAELSRASVGLRNWIIDSNRLAHNPLAIGFFWFWLAVSLLLISRDLIGHVRLARERGKWQQGSIDLRRELRWPDNVPLYLHPHMGPSAIGWLRPAVVLPRPLLSDMQPKAICQIARHELAHARWRDPLANALLRTIRALLWPSLPVWFLERWAYTEREAAADQAAIIDALAGTELKQVALDYAASLVSIAEREHTITVPGGFSLVGTQAGGRKVLENRVYRLLRISPRLNLVRATLGLAALLGGLVGMGLLPVVVADQSVRPKAIAQAKVTNRGEYGRIIFNGPRGPVLVRKTETGEIEEPVLDRSEAEMKASAIEQVMPSLPQDVVSESGFNGVMVSILVDEYGKVFSARATAGKRNPVLEQRAVEAARKWTFTQATMAGKPIKVVGTLTFFGSLDRSKGWVEIR